jgi:anaerobic selenocysteine-containing dehydrogenase
LPGLNYGAAVHADKWIPVLPNTDAALQLAIIYVWITEDTFTTKNMCAPTPWGHGQVANMSLGDEDGIPKTPEWASKKCGVPEWTIKALAREFAAKTTSIAHYFGGGLIRGPFSHEPARLECILLGMQGLGGPGVHQHQLTYFGMPGGKRGGHLLLESGNRRTPVHSGHVIGHGLAAAGHPQNLDPQGH